jgi:arsenate reductase
MNQPNDGKPYNVLFLCTGNSARSIMAEALMNRLGAGKFKGYSAGSMPTGRVNPHTVALLQKLNYKTDQFRSKAWEEFSRDTIPDAPELNFVFTVCDNAAGEMCPIWPGQPMTAHWGIEDPAAVRGNDAEVGLAFAEAYRQLNNRISTFVNLPLASLDRLALQTRLDEIGKTRVARAPTEQ